MKNNRTNALIGSLIKTAREEAQLSQADLAKILGYESATAVSLIEAGERKVKAEDLQKISEAVHRPFSYFLGMEERLPDIKVALRADKDLTNDDKEAISHFIDLAKKRRGK